MHLSAETYEQIINSIKSDAPRQDDERKSPRVGVRASVMVVLMHEGRAVQESLPLRDLSAGGLGLLCRYPLPIDSQFLVQLPSREGEAITVACKVRHCQQIAQKLFSVGACFVRQITRSPRPAAPAQAATPAVTSAVAAGSQPPRK